MPVAKHSRGYFLTIICVVLLAACGGSAPGDGDPQNVVELSDEPTVFIASTGEEITFPAVDSDYDAEVEVLLTRTGSQGMPAEAQLLTRAVTLTFRNLAELPDGSAVFLDLPHLESAALRAQGQSSNSYVLVSGSDRAAAINHQDWQYFGDLGTANDRSVLTVTKAGLNALALSLGEGGSGAPTLDGKPIGLQIATNIPDLFKPAEEGLYRVNLNSASAPSIQEAATDPVEYCQAHHGSLLSRLPSSAAPTGQEQRAAILLVHGYQSIRIPLGDNLSEYAHCNVWLNTIAAFGHQDGDWQTLRNQSDLYAVRYDTDDRVMLSGSEVADYLHQLTNQLGYQEIEILPHSMGGVVSVVARQQAGYPEAVKGIVTLGTPHMGAPVRCSVAEEGICLDSHYGPVGLVGLVWLATSGISLIAPSDGGLDLTFAYPDQDATTVANPYLVNLWLEGRNRENVHAIYGSNEFPTFDTRLIGEDGKTWIERDVGYSDMFIPASSAAGSRTLNKDGTPYASMFSRVTGVGRGHEQLHAGCNGCSDGRTSQDPYDPYFGGVASAMLEFVPVIIDEAPELDLLWHRQFGTGVRDLTNAVAVDAFGNVLVAGITYGSLAGPSAGGIDAFLREYDAAGNEIWTRQFGTSDRDRANGVAVDAFGNVLVAGSTSGALAGPNAGDEDAFVRKYDAAGTEIWTRQFDTSDYESALAVAVDASGNVIVVGQLSWLDVHPTGGNYDAFVRRYDGAGNELWTRQFGTNPWDWASGVAVDPGGNVVVVGFTLDRRNDSFVFLRKYDTTGMELWTRQFANSGWRMSPAVAVDASGNTVVAGSTHGALAGPNAGDEDAFVRKLSP